MGYSMIKNSLPYSYGVVHYQVDTVDEVKQLSYHHAVGSTAEVVEDGSVYTLTGAKEWVKKKNSGSSGSGEGGGGTTPSENDHIFYDGGEETTGIDPENDNIFYDGGLET